MRNGSALIHPQLGTHQISPIIIKDPISFHPLYKALDQIPLGTVFTDRSKMPSGPKKRASASRKRAEAKPAGSSKDGVTVSKKTGVSAEVADDAVQQSQQLKEPVFHEKPVTEPPPGDVAVEKIGVAEVVSKDSVLMSQQIEKQAFDVMASIEPPPLTVLSDAVQDSLKVQENALPVLQESGVMELLNGKERKENESPNDGFPSTGVRDDNFLKLLDLVEKIERLVQEVKGVITQQKEEM